MECLALDSSSQIHRSESFDSLFDNIFDNIYLLHICKAFLILFIFIVLAVNINIATAITANAPDKADRTLIYYPNLKKEYSIFFGGSDLINISVSGDLARFMTLKDANPNTGPRTVTMVLHISQSANLSPGWHEGYVVGTEISKQQGMVTGLAAIAVSFKVLQLYPGVFIIGSLSAPNTGINQTVFFQTHLTNWGTDNVSSIYAIIRVYSLNGTVLGEIKTDTKPLLSKASITLGAYFNTKGLRPGGYKATSTVFYDHESKLIDEKRFRIGIRSLRILNYTKAITQGVINRFIITVENLWNQPANNVYAEITINKTNFKTPSEIIQAFGVTNLKGFIDGSNLNPGLQPLTIKLFLGSEDLVEIKDMVNVLKIRSKQEVKGTNWLIIILIVLLILLIINLLLYFFVFKKHAKTKLRKR